MSRFCYVFTFMFVLLFSSLVKAADQYEVDLKIEYKEKLLASPQFVVKSGKSASLTMSMSDTDGYWCEVTVKPNKDSKHEVDVKVKFKQKELTLEPEFEGVELGKTTNVIFNKFNITLLVK